MADEDDNGAGREPEPQTNHVPVEEQDNPVSGVEQEAQGEEADTGSENTDGAGEGEQSGAEEQAADGEGGPRPEPRDDGKRHVSSYQKRLNEVTAARREAERRAEAAEARLAEALGHSRKDGEEQQDGQRQDYLPRAEVERLARLEAQRLSAEQAYQTRVQGWLANGKRDFPDFDDRCNVVASFGASDRPEFMQIVTDMDNGHEVVAKLADDPDEAVRILALPPTKMAMELARLGMPKAAPVKQVSRAPAPVRPTGGNSPKAEPDLEKVSMDEYVRIRNEQERRLGAR